MTAHTDHPLRHHDRTCPACNENAAAQVMPNVSQEGRIGHSTTAPEPASAASYPADLIGCVQHDCAKCKKIAEERRELVEAYRGQLTGARDRLRSFGYTTIEIDAFLAARAILAREGGESE